MSESFRLTCCWRCDAPESELSSDSRLGKGDARRSVLLGRERAYPNFITRFFETQTSSEAKTTPYGLKNIYSTEQ